MLVKLNQLLPGVIIGLVCINGKSYTLGNPICDCLYEEFQLKGGNPVPSVGPFTISASKLRAML